MCIQVAGNQGDGQQTSFTLFSTWYSLSPVDRLCYAAKWVLVRGIYVLQTRMRYERAHILVAEPAWCQCDSLMTHLLWITIWIFESAFHPIILTFYPSKGMVQYVYLLLFCVDSNAPWCIWLFFLLILFAVPLNPALKLLWNTLNMSTWRHPSHRATCSLDPLHRLDVFHMSVTNLMTSASRPFRYRRWFSTNDPTAWPLPDTTPSLAQRPTNLTFSQCCI